MLWFVRDRVRPTLVFELGSVGLTPAPPFSQSSLTVPVDIIFLFQRHLRCQNNILMLSIPIEQQCEEIVHDRRW